MLELFPTECHKMLSCFHPSTVVFVDDSKDFLQTIEGLVNPMVCRRTFNDSVAALNYFTKDYNPDLFTQRCVKYFEPDVTYHKAVDINLEIIYEEMYRYTRFEQISVLCVDHAMPDMTGVELCEQLKAFPFKKILLTGVAGADQAVDAFNRGVIDSYIVKNTNELKNEINNTIARLQYEFFAKQSGLIIDSIIADTYHGPSCLDDRLFIQLFQSCVNKVNAVEYYLHDDSGSYVLLDFNANPSFLTTKSEKQMDDLYAICQDWQMPDDILKAVQAREMIPYFHDESDYDEEDLSMFFHSAHKLEGAKTNYYYAFIENSDLYNIDEQRLLAYKQFLKNY